MNPTRSRYYTYIKPVLRSKSVHEYGPLIFSLVMVSFFSIFALRPTLTTIATLQKSIEEQQTLNSSIKQKIEDLKTAKNNYLAINQDTRTKVDVLIPNDTELPSLINKIRNLAATYDASISGIQFETIVLDGKPQALVAKPIQKDIPFTISLKGPYERLTQFADALPKVERNMTIDNITLHSDQENGLLMAINGRAFYFKH